MESTESDTEKKRMDYHALNKFTLVEIFHHQVDPRHHHPFCESQTNNLVTGVTVSYKIMIEIDAFEVPKLKMTSSLV